MRRLPILAALLPAMLIASAASGAAPGAAPGAAQREDRVPAATPTGEPVSCIPTRQVKETRVRSDAVIDFVMRNGTVYRNTLPMGCPRLGSERRFIHRTTLDQYCSVDTITVLESPAPSQGASCGLGKFQPVKLADTKKR